MDNLVYLFNFMICAQIFLVRVWSQRERLVKFSIGQRLLQRCEPQNILESAYEA